LTQGTIIYKHNKRMNELSNLINNRFGIAIQLPNQNEDNYVIIRLLKTEENLNFYYFRY